MVNYLDSFKFIWKSCKIEWQQRGPTKNFIFDFLIELKENLCLKPADFLCCLLVALLFTIFRKKLSSRILEPLAQSFNFTLKNQRTFPESSFKFLVYLIFFSAECVTLFSRYPEFISNPEACWKGWKVGMDVPFDLYWIYIAETGFYIHGIYATLFMDIWRDDSIVMLLHHLLTISLIIFSLALRYHRIGLVVLFLHDIADVILEFTKLSKCFQERASRKSSTFGNITVVGFLLFASAWIGCRLYWYPILVLYSTGFIARTILPNAPFYFFFNGMLWLLFVMNIWWAYFIILLIWRILTGKSKHIEDTRELSKKNDQLQSLQQRMEVEAVCQSNGKSVLEKAQIEEKRKIIRHSNSKNTSSGDDLAKDYVFVTGDRMFNKYSSVKHSEVNKNASAGFAGHLHKRN